MKHGDEIERLNPETGEWEPVRLNVFTGEHEPVPPGPQPLFLPGGKTALLIALVVPPVVVAATGAFLALAGWL